MTSGVGWRRGVVCVLLFSATLLGAGAAWRSLAPFPPIPQVRDKLENFTAAQPCEVAFFGSSRIYSGLIPELFDATMQSHGVQVRSYNLGVDGMSFPESGYFCERALARAGGRLRWVFIEAASVRVAIPANVRGTPRLAYWHDWQRTADIWRVLTEGGWEKEDEGRDAGRLMREHLGLFASWLGNAGDGAALLRERVLPPERSTGRDRVPRKTRGYSRTQAQIGASEAQKLRAHLENPNRLLRRTPNRAAGEILRGFAQRVARAGATVIFVVSPNPRASPAVFDDTDPRPAPPVFAFDEPQRYPELYRLEHRADAVHLNDAGARLFTAAVAERFAELLAVRR